MTDVNDVSYLLELSNDVSIRLNREEQVHKRRNLLDVFVTWTWIVGKIVVFCWRHQICCSFTIRWVEFFVILISTCARLWLTDLKFLINLTNYFADCWTDRNFEKPKNVSFLVCLLSDYLQTQVKFRRKIITRIVLLGT